MAEILELAVSWVITTALLFAVVIFDERRMDEATLERAWPPASRDAAIVYFGLLALPLHFARTRGDLRSARGVAWTALGLVLGVIAATAIVLVDAAVLWVLENALGMP